MPLPRSAHLVIRAILAPGRRQAILLLALLLLGTLLLMAFTGQDVNEQQDREENSAAVTTGMIERHIPRRATQQSAGVRTTLPEPLPEPPPVFEPAPTRGADLVLIIDDLGNNLPAGQRALALPSDITFAILPHTPHAHDLAEQAHAAGKEVMLHAPMSNRSGTPLGQGGLTPELDRDAFRTILDEALAAVPHIRGVNNHTGSDLTAREQPMEWLMETLAEQKLYFVDSVTTNDSVAGKKAEERNIPFLRRQVFLDHSTQPDDIDHEFRRWLGIARREGLAVGIGHPYPETLDYLEVALPALAAAGYRLRFVSEVLPDRMPLTERLTTAP